MYILGLGGSNHDYSACLLKDGKIRFMIEDERIVRKKNAKGLGLQLARGFSWRYCLSHEQIELEDVEIIAANDILNPVMYRKIPAEIKLINHHLSHAAASYYTSGFEEAAVLVLDSVGSRQTGVTYESGFFGVAEKKSILPVLQINGKNIEGTDYIENSLGIFYSLITQVIGFGEHQEGKTMGLAPYGTDACYKSLKDKIRYLGDGRIAMNQKDIEDILAWEQIVTDTKDSRKQFELKADLAWAAQTVLEEIIIEMCKFLKQETKMKKLCLSGGIFLNSVANYRIYKEQIFDEIFIPPACGDSGTSIGSAFYSYYNR